MDTYYFVTWNDPNTGGKFEVWMKGSERQLARDLEDVWQFYNNVHNLAQRPLP